MPGQRTFLDADVLINAFRGTDELAKEARRLLNDPAREFVTSDILRLELLPKAHFNKQSLEEQFYEAYLSAATEHVTTTPQLVQSAESEAKAAGLAAGDALHVAAAKEATAKEFFTAERATKPLFRVSGISVRSIRP